MEAIFKNDRMLVRLNKAKEVTITKFIPGEEEEDEDDDENKLTRMNTRTSSIRKMPKKKNARQLKREQEEAEKKRIEEEFKKRNQENEILNPYIKILRVDDLLAPFKKKERERILSSLEIVVLRYNTLLRNLFAKYKEYQLNTTRYTFTIKMRVFWQLLRDARILSHTLSLAEFNSIYFSNSFNKIENHFDIHELRLRLKDLKLRHYGDNERKIEVLKKMDVYLRNDNIEGRTKRIDYERFKESLEEIKNLAEGATEKDVLVE